MKSYVGLRYTTTLDFAAGRTIIVWVDNHGFIYWAIEANRVMVVNGTRRLVADHWQAAA